MSSPALKWFARPAQDRGGRRLSFQRLRSGGALVVRRLAKLVGEPVSRRPRGASWSTSRGCSASFLARADAIERLLRGPDVAFLLVLAPAVAAVDEALFFHARLREAGIPLGGFVANRVQPAPGLDDAGAMIAALRADPAFAGLSEATIAEAAGRLAPLAGAFGALRVSERRELARLGARAPGIAVAEVPLLDHDVDNLGELRAVGEHLMAAT